MTSTTNDERRHGAGTTGDDARRPEGRAQTGAEGVAAPLAPTAARPSQSTRTDADATTSLDDHGAARRRVVFAILRELPRSELAAVLVALATWLRSIVAALDVLHQSGDSAKAAAKALVNTAAESLFESDAATFTNDTHFNALSAAWFHTSPHRLAENLLTYDRAAAREALVDVEAARAELLNVNDGPRRDDASAPSSSPVEGKDARLARALRMAASVALERDGHEDGAGVALAVCRAELEAEALDSLAVALADVAARLCRANHYNDAANVRELDVAARAFEAAALVSSLWRERRECIPSLDG